MPSRNWDELEDSDFELLPEGFYLCELIDIHERQTRNGDEMWNLEFEVFEGPKEGRKVWDNLAFVGKGWNRAMLIAKRLGGVELKGDMNLTQEMILKKKAWINIQFGEYKGKKKNIIPFDGYESVEDYKARDFPAKKEDEEDIPDF